MATPKMDGMAGTPRARGETNAQSDRDLAEAAMRRLTSGAAIASQSVTLAITDGWVTLTGTVDWRDQKAAAERMIRTLPGVRGVTNNVTIVPR